MFLRLWKAFQLNICKDTPRAIMIGSAHDATDLSCKLPWVFFCEPGCSHCLVLNSDGTSNWKMPMITRARAFPAVQGIFSCPVMWYTLGGVCECAFDYWALSNLQQYTSQRHKARQRNSGVNTIHVQGFRTPNQMCKQIPTTNRCAKIGLSKASPNLRTALPMF